MRVEIISATEKPVEVISLAAGICYGKDNVSEKRIAHCFNNGHMSVFEHAHVTFRIEGISRACMAQLTRHRVASFCVSSQRYIKYDLSGDEWYATPSVFEDNEHYPEYMAALGGCYMDCLESGMKPEDARYLLPEATKTNLIMTCNLRELFHILDMRLSKSAQWEIRNLATLMLAKVCAINEQWGKVMGLYGGVE